MAFEFKVVIDPSPRALARILGEKKRWRDWRPSWRRSLPAIASGLARNIRGQGAPIGSRWPALSSETLKRRGRSGRGRAALVATGQLLAQISSTSGGARGGRRSLTRGRVRFGIPASKTYGYVQQFGSKTRRIPARPFIGWNTPMRNAVLDQMEAQAKRQVAEIAREINRAAGGVGVVR